MAKKRIILHTILLVLALTAILLPFILDLVHYVNNKKIIESSDSTVESNVIIFDDANLLTKEEIKKLKEVMLPISSYCPVAFVTTNQKNASTESFTVEFFNQIMHGEGVVFTIDMYHRYLYIYTSDSNTKLSISKCETITDNIYTYATDKEYYLCAYEAWSQIYYVMSGISIPQPMKHISNLLIAICLGLVFTFFLARGMTKTKLPSEVYQLDKNTKRNVNFNNMNLVHVSTTRYKHSSSGGGGHGGGGGHSGGGGHGGGHGF